MSNIVRVYASKNSLRIIVPQNLLDSITTNHPEPHLFKLYGIERANDGGYNFVLEKYGYHFGILHYMGDKSIWCAANAMALVRYGAYKGFTINAKKHAYSQEFGVGKGMKLQVEIIHIQERIADYEDRVIAYKVIY